MCCARYAWVGGHGSPRRVSGGSMLDFSLPALVGRAVAPVQGVLSRLPRPARRRHVWMRPGRAHVEVRGVHRPEMAAMASVLERALCDVDGVDWASVNAVLG